MKNKNKRTGIGDEIPANWNNPFVGLKIELPKDKEESKPVQQPKVQEPKSKLSKEDQELLKAFGGDDTCFVSAKAGEPPKPGSRGKVSFNIQRKGKGGKTVTLVHGLDKLSIEEQMEMCSQVKKAMGCGARFLEGELEIQGDQRDRAAEWFRSQFFSC